MQINKILKPPGGGGLPRRPPIYRPSVDVMMSALKRYSALSRPQPMMNFNDQNRTVILSEAKDQRSEASLCPSSQTLRCAQGDKIFRYCHAERSEASLCPSRETLRGVYPERSEWAQGDKIFPILLVKNHYRPTANPPHTPILKLIIYCLVLLAVALSACNNQSQQVDPRLKYFVIIDSRVLIEANTAEVFDELENTSKMQFPFDVSMQPDLLHINGQMVGTATGTAEDVGIGQVRQFMLLGTLHATPYPNLKLTPVSL